MQVGQEELLSVGPSLLASVLRRFGSVRLRAAGRSMFPAIRPGDVLTVHRCSVDDVDEGDVVLVQDGERLFAHRLVEKQMARGETRLVTRGDSHWHNDPSRSAATLLGRITAVTREGMLVSPLPCTPARRAYGLFVNEWMRLRSRLAVVRQPPMASRN